ncbi:hypothetical protein BRADI_2g40965v3 [Brachypodium distachyon]|uniref:Reverse transcriptase zinc-binding domain-containing protein n=1 Tax=Brachypodium distachyon TaxID=15368 RepID=A0A2K2DD33_BRADI|nr:hypothetical protein BRADI_2g40965v3 [Brachypodium distachyon]
MLHRTHWQVTNDFTCVLCHSGTWEDWQHLFFGCQFSQRIWNYLQIQWSAGVDLKQIIIDTQRSFGHPFFVEWSAGVDLKQIIIDTQRSFGHPFFVEVAAMSCWHIWKQRNRRIFEGIRPSFRSWRRDFVEDISLLQHRFKPHWVAPFLLSLRSLP